MGLGAWMTRGAAPAAVEVRQSAAMDSFAFALAAAEGSGSISGDFYRGFMGIPGVERAASLICSVMANVQWDAFKDASGKALDPAGLPLLNDPCPPLTKFDVVTSLSLDYLFHGIAFAIVTDRDENGTPTTVLPVPAWSVQVLTFTDLPYYLTPPDLRAYRVGGLELNERDLLRICAPSGPGALRGQGVIEKHFATMGLARDLNRQAQAVVKEGGVPTGIVSNLNPDAVEGDIEQLRESWMERMKYRGVAFTNGQVAWQSVAWNPTEAQLIEARAFSLIEIALIMGLPGHFLEAGPANADGMKYSTTVMEADELMKFGKPAEMVVAFEQAFSRKLPSGTSCRANYDNLLRADPQVRATIANLGIDGGWLLRSEVRADERLPAIAGIDDAPAPVQAPVPPVVGGLPAPVGGVTVAAPALPALPGKAPAMLALTPDGKGSAK